MTEHLFIPLNKLRILPALPNDCYLEVFETLPSTSEYAKAHSELSTPRIILAEQQTAGVGRLGRPWISPFGCHLYYTLMWDYYAEASVLSSLSLRVALSIVKALNHLGIRGIQLKWPNDILYQGAKLGGVLIHNQGVLNGATRLCISFGLNVNPMSDEDRQSIDRDIACLFDITGKIHDRNSLVVAITQQLFCDLAEFTLQDDQKWMQEWRSLDTLYGSTVSLSNFSTTIVGIARGITPSGQLILEDSQGNQHLYSAGDVTLSPNLPIDKR